MIKSDLPVDSEEDRYAFLNFCMFLAEMFSRIKVVRREVVGSLL